MKKQAITDSNSERYCKKCKKWSDSNKWAVSIETCDDCYDEFTAWICPRCGAHFNNHVSTDVPGKRRRKVAP